jgi:hypothetical protein
MKRKFFQFLIAGVIVVAGGCGKSKFLDINNDPNNPTDVPPKVLLPASTIGVAFANGNELSRVASLMIQHNAGTANQALGFDVYNLDGNFDNAWNFEIYSNAISDLRALIKKTETTSPAYSGMAKILLAYVFSVSTDIWGDVPYSQAGFGLDFPNPRFDKQEDIYQGNATLGIVSLFDLVKSGLADLDKPSALLPGADDLIYAGSLPNWKRAGNTLILKFAIQISGVNATLAKSQIDAVITGNNYITTNAQDWDVPFGTAVGSQSPLYSFNVVNRPTDQMLSNTFLNLMNSQNDQVRLGKLYTSPGGVFSGFDNGSTAVPPGVAVRSRYNEYVTGSATVGGRIRLLTNSHRAFLLSEAALMLGTAGDANALYQEGIKANMAKTGMTTGEIDAYFLANPTIVTLTGTNAQKRRQIIIQKYISFVPNPIEAYNDFRRTGYPQLSVAQNASGDDPSTIPKRYTYPPNEVARNPNAPKPRPLTNVKVWWGL